MISDLTDSPYPSGPKPRKKTYKVEIKWGANSVF